MIKGIDVASFQHPHDDPIDFALVKQAGYEFVYIKATEGVGYVNPFFVHDIQNAHKAGLAVGAYTYIHPDVDAVAAANKFDETVKLAGVHLDLPVGLDFETKPATVTAKLAHERLDQLRTVLHQHGYRTMTYSYPYFLQEVIPHDCAWCGKDPLWLAGNYGGKSAPAAPGPWSKVTVWQNYDKESVKGVMAASDSDIFQGNEAEFEIFAGKAKPAPHLPAWYHRLLEYPPSKLRNPGHLVQGLQEGEDAKAVQRRLGVKPDGLYGPNTASHVKGFQKLHKLTNDGVVGPDTAKALG